MTYNWLTDLDAALATAGVPFVEVPASASDATGAASWHTRGRPVGTGDGFFPDGIVCHHTASPVGCSPENDLRVILAGNSDAPGPISQLYIGRDAVLYLVAAGRANHAGSGMRPGLDFTCTDMNARNLGIEVGNNGVGEPWGDDVCDTYGRTVAALLDWYGWDLEHVYLHNTTGPPSGGCNSKIDPAGPWTLQRDLTSQTWDLPTWRGFVDAYRGGAQPPQPEPPTEEDDVLPCPTLIQADGSDGTVAGAVYVTDGRFVSLRWVANTYELADIQYWLRAAGQPDAITSVARISSYGTLTGPPAAYGASAARFEAEP